MSFLTDAVQAGELIVGMTWDTWWALVLGFGLSGAVEAFVSEESMRDVLGDDDWRAVARGAVLGAASSSCSYSAVGTTKTLFKKGASGVASLGAFMFASTDLVVELGFVLWVLLGWQFVVGEYLGGVVAVLVLGAVFKYAVPQVWLDDARERVRASDETSCGTCDVTVDPTDPETVRLDPEDDSDDRDDSQSDDAVAEPVYFCCGGCRRVYVTREGTVGGGDGSDDDDGDATGGDASGGGVAGASLGGRLLSVEGWRSAARASTKDWEMLWRDVALGFVIAGVVGGFVPDAWWLTLFPAEGTFAGVAAATLVAIAIGVVTFMCSVGNVPFALVLWQNGLPFGAVLSFIYADLLIPPLVNVYRKCYGFRLAAALVVALALAAAVAGITVHYVAGALGIVPPSGTVGGTIPDHYTAALNLVFTPIFLLQIVATYGLATVRERTTAAVVRAVETAQVTINVAGRTVELATGAIAAVLAEPRTLPAVLQAEVSNADVGTPAATAARGADCLRAAIGAGAVELGTAIYRVAVHLDATQQAADGDHDGAGDDGDGERDTSATDPDRPR